MIHQTLKTLLIRSVLILLLMILGCSREEKVTIGQKKIVINFIDLGSPSEMKRMNALIKRFEQNHPRVKVRVEYPPSPSDVRQKILLATIGNMPLDIVYLNDTVFPEFVDKGCFEPLDNFIENDKSFNIDDFYSEAIECATFNRKIYSIPPLYGTYIAIYNKSLLKEQDIPYPRDGWSWEEFRETCKKLTIDRNGDGKPEQFGCLGTHIWVWLPMIFQNGGRIFDDNGRCVFNSREVVETFQFLKNMYIKDRVFVSHETFPGSVGMKSDYLFSTGRVAMMFTEDFGMTKNFPKELDWDIVAPPEKKGGKKYFHGGFWGYAITSRSRNKEPAWEFLKFLTSEEVVAEWIEGIKDGRFHSTGAPSRKSLRNEFLSILPDKHLESYLYCLQYPEFKLAQPWGKAAINEVSTKYNIMENVMGITHEDIQILLDDFTREVNKLIRKRIGD